MTLYRALTFISASAVTPLARLADGVRPGMDMKMRVPAVSAAACESQAAFTFAGELIASCGDNGLGGQKL